MNYSRIRPSPEEIEFLNYAYDTFFLIQKEITSENFWSCEPYYRLAKIRDALLVYSEILEYQPIGWYIEHLKKTRPPMEAELSFEYLMFLRNVLVHFPFFQHWDDIVITKGLVNWSKPGRSIDRFLTKFSGNETIQYRMWNKKKKQMTHLSIDFPKEYTNDTKIKLNDFMPEKDGFVFAFHLMKQVLLSQIEIAEDTTEG